MSYKLNGVIGTELNWFKSHLLNRKQHVTKSSYSPTQCGFPDVFNTRSPFNSCIHQWSVFGIKRCAFHFKHRPITHINNVLDRMDIWFKRDKLSLNVKKPKNRTLSDHPCPILIANNALEYVPHVQVLWCNHRWSALLEKIHLLCDQ